VASDRKSRRGEDEMGAARKKGATQQQDQEQEQEQQQQQEVEAEHARMQNQMGNEGLNAIFGIPSVSAGQDGSVLDLRDRGQEVARDFGGDDDAPADGGLSLEELVSSWNPGIKKSQDRAAFHESGLADGLPPPDDALRAAARAMPWPDASAPGRLDALVQPPLRAIASGGAAWTAELGRWLGSGLDQRTGLAAVRPPAPLLGDPFGRPLLGATRSAALATCLLLDAPICRDAPTPATAAFLQLCMDLACGEPIVREVWITAAGLQNELPIAARLLAPWLPEPPTRTVVPEPLPGPARQHALRLIHALFDLPRATTYLNALQDPASDDEVDEDDDPLGIDALLGPPVDREEGLYDAAVQCAERLAAHAARMRVQLAGTCAAVARACDAWLAGAPDVDLVAVADRFDGRVNQVLGLLVEVARAAQKRTVVVRGLANGLRRAANQVDQATDEAAEILADLLGGVLPTEPEVPLHRAPPDDPWAAARDDGVPARALPWIASLPPGLTRQVAEVWARVCAGQPPAGLADPLLAAREAARTAGRPALAAALGVAAGPALLWAQRTDEAAALGRALADEALERRNGVAAADAYLLQLEARHAAGLATDAIRLEGARRLYWGGNLTGFELLLRWTPPEEA
jgi:hypothetical protein